MGVLSDASVGTKNFVVNHRKHQHRLNIMRVMRRLVILIIILIINLIIISSRSWLMIKVEHLVLIVDNLSVSNRLVLGVQPTESGRRFCLCLMGIMLMMMRRRRRRRGRMNDDDNISFWYCTIYQSQDC